MRITLGFVVMLTTLILNYVPTHAQEHTDPIVVGQHHGWADGTSEAREGADDDGYREGCRAGERQGFEDERGRIEERVRAHGYREGHCQGAQEGTSAGTTEGTAAGQAEGLRDGRQHGADDARTQAESAARAPATAKGEEEAKASDATAVGRASGDSEGHQAALERAKTFDLQRGRDAYRNERLNAPPRSRETTSRDERRGGLDGLLAATHPELLAQAHVSIPSPRRSCARSQAPVAPNEASRYWEGYWRCYDEGYRHAYVEGFRAGYARGCADGEQRGIARAQRRDYDSELAAAREQGYREGYASSHDSAYASARAAAYTPAHAGAYTAAHDETYGPAYTSAFERIRGEAYTAAYTRLREAARTAAKASRYNAEYPTFAVCWYLRGRQLEADDFRQRPVRILGVDASTLSTPEADAAGREVSIRVKLRNFSNASVARESFIYAVDCTPAAALVRVDPRPGLTRALRPESEVDVADMLRIRLSDAVRGTVRVTLKVALGKRGQITDTAVVDVPVPASK